MKLTSTLLGFLSRVFDKRPHEFLAFRMTYDGSAMTWLVSDGWLYTTTAGGTGGNLALDLSQYTMRQLVTYIGTQQGYTILYWNNADEYADISSMALLDAAGDQSVSNGDHLYAYTSLLYAYMEPVAAQLEVASASVDAALQQMNIQTAESNWLDFWGAYFNVLRNSGETDPAYSARMLAQILTPRSNNIAMEIAISNAIGNQPVTVEDVVTWTVTGDVFNGAISYDGVASYNANGAPSYGLFDVTYGYDLLSGSDPTAFAAYVTSIVENVRASGTHLRSLLLSTSQVSDTVSAPTDGNSTQTLVVSPVLADTVTDPSDSYTVMPITMNVLGDSVSASSDGINLLISYTTIYNGFRNFDGSGQYGSGTVINQTF